MKLDTQFFRAAFIAALAALPSPAVAQVELKLGHAGELGSLIGAAADEFA